MRRRRGQRAWGCLAAAPLWCMQRRARPATAHQQARRSSPVGGQGGSAADARGGVGQQRMGLQGICGRVGWRGMMGCGTPLMPAPAPSVSLAGAALLVSGMQAPPHATAAASNRGRMQPPPHATAVRQDSAAPHMHRWSCPQGRWAARAAPPPRPRRPVLHEQVGAAARRDQAALNERRRGRSGGGQRRPCCIHLHVPPCAVPARRQIDCALGWHNRNGPAERPVPLALQCGGQVQAALAGLDILNSGSHAGWPACGGSPRYSLREVGGGNLPGALALRALLWGIANSCVWGPRVQSRLRSAADWKPGVCVVAAAARCAAAAGPALRGGCAVWQGSELSFKLEQCG